MDRRSEELVVGYNRHEKSVPPALRPFVSEVIRLRRVVDILSALSRDIAKDAGETLDAVDNELATR